MRLVFTTIPYIYHTLDVLFTQSYLGVGILIAQFAGIYEEYTILNTVVV